MKYVSKMKRRTLIAAGVLLLLCAAALLGLRCTSRLLDSQRADERWRGESEMKFNQVSCFLPVDEKLSLEQIYTFRNEIQKKLHEAAVDIDTDAKLFNDAWCTFGKVNVSSEQGKGEVYAIAVGGSFFEFHPLRLLSGSYITEADFTHDRVLLDEDTAWLLFGGTQLQGMSFKINGVPFVVAGVIEREDDAVSKKAYTSGMGIYMSYDAYMALDETAAALMGTGESTQPDGGAQTDTQSGDKGISCYELVLAEPVKGFTYSLVSEKFPIGGGEIVDNGSRYDALRLLKLAGKFGSRSMQTQGVVYPYWENAARCTEDWSMALLIIAILAGIMPAVTVTIMLVSVIRALWKQLAENVLPKTKDRVQESIRVRQRRRWEKKHPGKQ